MSNQKRLKEYLIGENGYLKSNISNGKVIMLSGKWGSGKTHFWKNIIATDDLKKELSDKEKAYSYISLYGKSSIEEIENDIFTQIYFSAIDGDNLATKTFSTFTKYSKRYGKFLSSKIKDLADGLEEEQKDNKERIALERLENGGIICFDDFERKSKDIDLNDLFGFITQITLNFNCKIIIILNDDVFKGEEKKIFSSVKEKSVSKFLKYEPNINDLFDSIFDKDERYRVLDEYKELILNTIEESKELNARIYIQVLDNLTEWIDKNQENNQHIFRSLILSNIKFINFHKLAYKEEYKVYDNVVSFNNQERSYRIENRYSIKGIPESIRDLAKKEIKLEWIYTKEFPLLEEIKYKNSDINVKELINDYKEELNVLYFAYTLRISKNVKDETFQKISNFIETGIL